MAARTALRCLLILVISCSTQLLAFNNIVSSPLSCQRLSASRQSTGFRRSGLSILPVPPRSRRSTLVLRMAEEGGTAEEVEPVDVEAVEVPVNIEELKRELLVTMAGSNRGLSATKAQRDTVIELVSQLESCNPTPAPNSNLDSLCGTWRLMFTTAYDVLSLGAIPLVQTGEIFQNIRPSDPEDPAAGLDVDNVVNLQPSADAVLSALGGSSTLELVVGAKGKIVGEKRVDITFLSSTFQPRTLLGQQVAALLPPLSIPLGSPQSGGGGGGGGREAGYIRTTFLDSDMRIARGGAAGVQTPDSFTNNIFILWRDP